MDIKKILEKLDNLFAQNKTDDAEVFLSQSLESAISESDTGAVISIINELIGLYRDTSQFEKAVPYCRSLEKLIDKFGLAENINGATSYLNIANLYRASGDYEKSFEFYKKIRRIYDMILDDSDYLNASYYNNISLLYQETGDFAESCKCLEKALEIIKKLDAPYETASTLANLSLSYLHAGNVQKAEENALKSLEIFERDKEKDFHYSSALSAMGDVMNVKKDYPQAIAFYEKALEELHRRTGYTKSYRRLLANLESVSGEKFTGISLAEQYYNKFGKAMIDEKFPEYADKIAVGIAGEGSDCYGFDDRISRDHDFGCGFCMWLDDKTYNQIGEQLQAEYNKLPEYFRGFPKLRIRRGVFRISDFTKKISSYKDLYDIPDYILAELTNGKIFRDDSGILSGIREKYSYYPDNIRNARLAQALAQACQDGQCNYPRAMARGDILSAQLLLNDFANDVVNIAFILNRKYAPHKKWISKAMDGFEILPDIKNDLLKLFSEAPDLSSWQKVPPEEWYGRINYQDFHINIIEKICSDIASAMGISDSNYLENIAKEIFNMNIREQKINDIINIEWKMFDKVQNIGERASCQDDFETFSIMRRSQYTTWSEAMIKSYLEDLHIAEKTGRNLISEKYARMMEYTSPEEYKKLSLPDMSQKQRDIINQIAEIQSGMMEDFAEKYPKLAGNARDIRSSDDNIYNTSYETYLKGELSTYSPETLSLYGRFIVDLYRSGKNLAELTMLNTVKLYGYKNLDDAESKI